MQAILTRICELQPKYSSNNTPDMQERGKLIRSDLAEAIRTRLPQLRPAFDSVFDDLAVEGSDGKGRKTEAPWVRLFSKTMSPRPTEGFYVVIHFAADGSSVFFTVGCGSTIWNGSDLRPVSDDELARRTGWARSAIEHRWKTLAPFNDSIELGAKASLPQTFERATAIARRVPVDLLKQVDLERILYDAAERLGEIYLAQLGLRDVSQGDQDATEVIAIARPFQSSARRQGIGLTAAERKAIEKQAMCLAISYLEGKGFSCQDTSNTESFDLLATKADLMIKVEVKGTTSDICDSILMTKNEVELHRAEKGKTGLIIVSQIKLDRGAPEPRADGGVLEDLLDWDVDKWTAVPVAYQIVRP